MEYNINDKINLLYDFIYNQNTQNCFTLENITLGKIGLDDIKLSIPEIDDENYELNKNEILQGKFKVVSFDEENNQIYLKKYSNQFPITIKISLYNIKDKPDNLLKSPINNDSLFSYILSELILYKKTKHIILPLLNIDVKISEIEKIVGDDEYYSKIKNLIKNNIIQDTCCLQLREHFFKSVNLFDYLKENKCIYKGLLFQVIHTLAVLQSEYKGFRHNNLILKNIFIYLKKNDDIYTEYNGFKDDKFYLPNVGFDIKITNFEKSIIPKFYEIEKKDKNDYYDLYTFLNDLISYNTINKCDTETDKFFNKYLPEDIRKKFKDNQEIIKPVNLLYDKYFDSFKTVPTKKNDKFNDHQYLTSKIIETFINSDNYSTLGNQNKIKSKLNIMINKRLIKKEKFTTGKINRIEQMIPDLVGGYEKAPYTAEKNTPFISNDERNTFNKKKEENPVREPPVLLEQKIYDTSNKPAKKDNFPPPYIPVYDPNSGNVGPQMYPYNNILGQPPVQQKMYNITLSNPIGPHTTINKIYEDIIPGEPRVYSSLTIYERTQLINFIRNTIIDNHDGEDMDISGGKNSLLSFIKVMDCNPYSTKHNPYHDLSRDFILYRAAYPVRYNGDRSSIEIAKKSVGMNVRMYKMTIGAIRCNSIESGISKYNFDLWREISYYEWVKNDIIKKKVSPNFISHFLYKIDTKSRINWEKLEEIKKKVQIESVRDDLIRNQQQINKLHSINKTLGQLSLILPQNNGELSGKGKYIINMIKISDEYMDKINHIKGKYNGEEHDKIKKQIDEEYKNRKEQLQLIYNDFIDIDDKDDLYLDSGKVLILLTEAPNSNILQWSGPVYEKFGTIRKMTSTGYHTPEVWKSILFQLVYACAVLQNSGIVIENFSLENNIFIKDIFTDYNSIGSWIYKVDNVSYYIPNYGYILMIDSKFSDVEIDKTDKDKQKYKLWSNKLFNDRDESIKKKLVNQFLKIIDPDNYRHKLFIEGFGKLDSEIIDLIEKIYNKINSEFNKDSYMDISELIPIYFGEFVHNRVGSSLLKTEKENINKLSKPNFKKGDLMIYQRRYEEYVWVIYLKDNDKKCSIIIKDNQDKYIIDDVFKGSLFGYPESETILPESKRNMKYDEYNIYETYDLNNINK